MDPMAQHLARALVRQNSRHAADSRLVMAREVRRARPHERADRKRRR